MAVALQLAPTSNFDSWALANPIQLPARVPESMTAAMSYQYPIPSSGPNVDIQSSNSINKYHLPSIIPPPSSRPVPKPHSPIRHGASVGQKQQKMKRSLSTPNVRAQAKTDGSESAMSAEKRRNKLGYHRTSVACGHCRRRKIRCIPAPGDPQNRCSNCIRLKKECQFYAVDQQPSLGERRDSDAQGTSDSSSPNQSGQASTMQQGLSYTQMPLVQELGSDMKGRTDSFSPENKGPFSRPQEFAPSSGGWMPNDSSNLSKAPVDAASSYWRLNSHESPLTPGFSPYSPSLQQLPNSNWPPAPVDQVAREELGWSSAPQRSMSYSHHETISHNSGYSSYHHPGAQSSIRDDFSHRTHQPPQSELYPPSLTPGANSISGTEASSSSTAADTPQLTHTSMPLPPPPFSTHSAQGWQQPYPYTKMPVQPGNETFGAWYNPTSAVPQQEGQGEGIAPITYGHPEPYGGMYNYPATTQGGRQ